MAFLEGVLSAPSQREVAAISRDHLQSLLASAHRGDRGLVARAETVVAAHPEGAFVQARDGSWRLEIGDKSWSAGSFEVPTLADLKDRCRESPERRGRLVFSILDGASPLTDIGGLQATSPRNALFQVASQFNCLESPGPYLVPVSQYFSDATQGPRAAVGAFPSALLRRYRAPGEAGVAFAQASPGPQLELLADACGRGVAPGGYLTGHGFDDPRGFADRLEADWAQIRVGVHDAAQVALGFDWDGAVENQAALVSQVTTSTVAGGYYGGAQWFGPVAFERVARSLLRAAYLGTLLAAVANQNEWAVLTLIGGGAFGNPIEWIWESILWALERTRSLVSSDLHVVLNGRDLSSRLDLPSVLVPAVERYSGRICRFADHGLVEMLA